MALKCVILKCLGVGTGNLSSPLNTNYFLFEQHIDTSVR